MDLRQPRRPFVAHDRWTNAWMYDPAAPYADYRTEWELCRRQFAALIGADVNFQNQLLDAFAQLTGVVLSPAVAP